MYECAPLLAPLSQPVVSTKEEPVETALVKAEPKIMPFEVRAYPNPSSTNFSIVVNSQSLESITVRVMDMSGNVLSVITKMTKGFAVNLGSDLRSGTYMAEVIQGTNKQVIKLVKLN